jgi:hypothetical protein
MQEGPSQKLKERIEDKLANGEKVKEIYDLESPLDCYIIERMAYYRFAIPLMTELGNNFLSEDNWTNCVIQMYQELRAQGRIYHPPKKRLTK